MNKNIFFWTVFLTVMMGGGICCSASAASAGDAVRSPAVAGRFYPDQPGKLRSLIKNYMAQAVPASGARPIALTVPHAGYVFSGQICADALNQAAGYSYDLIVILGVNHTVSPFPGASVFQGKGYETPLGIAEIDSDAVRRFAGSCPYAMSVPSAHRREHSIEVIIPFIQTVFPDTKILPMIAGSRNLKICRSIGNAIAETVRGKNALIIASTDLSHYPSYEDARRVDRKTLNAMLTLDPALYQKTLRSQEAEGVPNLSTCACGEAPVISAMTAARQMGARCGRLIRYASSGDSVHGDHDRVVGYGAVAYYANADCSRVSDAGNVSYVSMESSPGESAGRLSDQDKKILLRLARETLAKRFDSNFSSAVHPQNHPALLQNRGAFVTLNKHGRLRGCIGRMDAAAPLFAVVRKMALQAAFSDPRFRPLAENELDEIEIEISVLTPFQEIQRADEIQVGRDGVMLRKAGRSAVYLPQVAPEQGWGRDEMLSHLSRKAGLHSDAWKSNARLYIFQAVVFSE